MRAVLKAACLDPTRFHLNGALVECEGERMHVVTTDGHRLMAVTMPRDPEIPAGFVRTIGRLDAERVARGALPLVCTPVTSSGRSAFPPWRAVVPPPAYHGDGLRASPYAATVDRKALLALCRLAEREIKAHAEVDAGGRRLRSERGVELHFADGQLALHASTPIWNAEVDAVAAEGVARPMRIGLSLKYLIEAVAAFTGAKITITVPTSALDPVRFDGAGPAPESTLLVVVMPTRI
jgi:hypothetical protein